LKLKNANVTSVAKNLKENIILLYKSGVENSNVIVVVRVLGTTIGKVGLAFG